MGCCDKTQRAIQKTATTTKHIIQGWTALAMGKKYEFTDDRVRVCQDCDDNYWLGRVLFCSLCKCPIATAARVEAKECPRDRWPAIKSTKSEEKIAPKKI